MMEDIQSFTFQFAANIPCPGMPTVTYEGQVYNTVQIFSQCWLKENLNLGTMIPGEQDMTDNSVIGKYCFGDVAANCATYGGLYLWDEMMKYSTVQGGQGICPPDWHVPTDEEWKVLEGIADSQYRIGDPAWDGTSWKGYDAGLNLKSTSGWYSGGNGTDLFGFDGLPGGNRGMTGNFNSIEESGYWWSSTPDDVLNSWKYSMDYNHSDIKRLINYNMGGFSVRCIRNL